jgi:hypothetical protein
MRGILPVVNSKLSVVGSTDAGALTEGAADGAAEAEGDAVPTGATLVSQAVITTHNRMSAISNRFLFMTFPPQSVR